MARGRHRNSALHRVLIPAALGAVALACAVTSWVVSGEAGEADRVALRMLAVGAALTAVAGALLLRRWDLKAGLLVARERATGAIVADRLEERKAELDDAREKLAASQQAIDSLQEKLDAKRTDLRQLRTEHATLLRRYATAESERANALEGRRLLAIEAAEPTRALPARAVDHRTSGGAPTSLTYLQAHEALTRLSRSVARQRETRERHEEEEREAQEAREREERAALPPDQGVDHGVDQGEVDDGEGGEGTDALGIPDEPQEPPQLRPPAPVVPPPAPGNGTFDFFGLDAAPRSPASPSSGSPSPPDREQAQGSGQGSS